MSREEGFLSDAKQQRTKQQTEKYVTDLYTEDIRMLSRDGRFRRWFGKFAEPLLMMDVRTNNGGDLQHFAGRRSLVLEIIKEFDEVEPGFYGLVLSARQALKAELKEIDKKLRPEQPPDEE